MIINLREQALIFKSTFEATVLGFRLGIIGIRVQDSHFTKYEHAAVEVYCSQSRHWMREFGSRR